MDDMCNLISVWWVICGDLNYSGIDWERLHAKSPAEREVLDSVQNSFWTQYVDFPTHIGGATLDLVLCNCPELVVGVGDEGLFSDHRMLSVDLVKPVRSIDVISKYVSGQK